MELLHESFPGPKPTPVPARAVSAKKTPQAELGDWHYIRHNQRRQEHLASLNLPIQRASVLEVGAGIGDHTHFFLDRDCKVVTSEGRPENFNILRNRYPQIEAHLLDLDQPHFRFPNKLDIVYCYGVLYHLKQPGEALEYLAECCGKMLLLETCVSFGDGELLNPIAEPSDSASQAVSGQGCRPTRLWVFNQMKKHFRYVYVTATQPHHEEFPIDWTVPAPSQTLSRSVFVAARESISNALLLDYLPRQQSRH